MHILEIAQTLPNGFHDAFVSRLSIDYVERILRLDLDVWVGDSSAPPGPERERCRPGSLELDGLLFCVMEPPDPGYPYAAASQLMIDITEIEPNSAPKLPDDLPAGSFSFCIYVTEWNAFIYVAAQDSRFSWTG